jgi:small subunit ribosomal protein S19
VLTRNATILSNWVGSQLLVYNGKHFSTLVIRREMLGYKLGDFALTRKIGVVHAKKKKKK